MPASAIHCCGEPFDMERITKLSKVTVPLGGQDIELYEVEHVAGAMAMLRVRIREGRRFTIFDLDPESARQWGEAMAAWARAQPGADLAAPG